MLKRLFIFLSLGVVFSLGFTLAFGQEIREIWPDLPPGETAKTPDTDKYPGAASCVTVPRLMIYRPEKPICDVCVLLFPGGGYDTSFYEGEGVSNALWWNSRGVTAAVLIYRVPRIAGRPIYARAWQDAQRAVRVLRSSAEQYGFNPEKIGAQGFSAGGHLTLMTALCSQTPAYEPVDELDRLPCHVNFALPVYPPYVLDDGAYGPNERKGIDAAMLDDFAFDEKTPPICLIHGDADIYSPLGSIELFRRLYQKGVSCELHIYADAVHGFMNWDDLPNASTWRDRSFDWLVAKGFIPKP